MNPKGQKNLKVLQKKSKYQKRKAALNQKDDINEKYHHHRREKRETPYYDTYGVPDWSASLSSECVTPLPPLFSCEPYSFHFFSCLLWGRERGFILHYI